ncbi:hypothetical protein IWW38_005771, partial [Coemansia aciculifera]
MSQVLALSRFRRSNFTALWRQLTRLCTHCRHHFDELVEKIYASALFSESSLETHQLFRISQLYNVIQAGHAASNVGAGTGLPSLAAFPELIVWRGWVDKASVRKLHSKLGGTLSAKRTTLVSDTGGIVHDTADCKPNPRLDSRGTLKDLAPPSPPQTHKSSTASLKSTADDASVLQGEPTYTVYLDNVATLDGYQMGLSTDALQRDTLSLSWRKSAAGSNDQAIVR